MENIQNIQNIKKQIAEEFVKCAKDPQYFIENFCYIQSKNMGKVKFKLYPFQKELLTSLFLDKYIITNKSRQLGVTTLVALFSLWYILFNENKKVLCLSKSEDAAKNILTMIKYSLENLPNWLKMETTTYNELSISLLNESSVKVKSGASSSGRSESSNILILDEAAFIPNTEELFASTHPSLSIDGKCFVVSTPKGLGNWFHKMFTEGESGTGMFKATFRLPWTMNPDLNEKWRQDQTLLLGPKLAEQECDAEFLASGESVFDLRAITTLEQVNVLEPIEKKLKDNSLWIWNYPQYDRKYLISADVARGDSSDFSTFHILDMANVEQVAEFKLKIDTADFANLLVNMGQEYNHALLVIENTGIGWSVIQDVIKLNYRNLYYSQKGGSQNTTLDSYLSKEYSNNLIPGFTTSLKTRPLVINKLSEYINTNDCIIKSIRLINELKTMIFKNGKAQASNGFNDDLVMALGIALYLRDTTLQYKNMGLDLQRKTLDNFKTASTPINLNKHYTNTNIAQSYSRYRDVFKVRTGDGLEEDFSNIFLRHN